MESIQKNIKTVQKRINKACQLSGRDANEVKLLLATKTIEPERIIRAFNTVGNKLIVQ